MHVYCMWCISEISTHTARAIPFHEFDDSFVNTPNAMFPNLDVDGGFCCLNDNGGKTGLIRFYSGDANPKWGFEMKADGEIEWGGA